jgi:adenine/guanine phosphoribosyltransferase-like PRPP-binding protein
MPLMTVRETYKVEIEGVTRELPLFAVGPEVRIAVFNLLGDTEIIGVAAEGLASRLAGLHFDVLVTAETKSVPLAYHLAALTAKPWVVLRKSYKSYMGDALSAETLSITTGSPQTLYLDEKDQRLEKVDAHVVCEAAVFTEGDPERWAHVVALGHLPVFTERTGES